VLNPSQLLLLLVSCIVVGLVLQQGHGSNLPKRYLPYDQRSQKQFNVVTRLTRLPTNGFSSGG
jgi:hypothetical protein